MSQQRADHWWSPLVEIEKAQPGKLGKDCFCCKVEHGGRIATAVYWEIKKKKENLKKLIPAHKKPQANIYVAVQESNTLHHAAMHKWMAKNHLETETLIQEENIEFRDCNERIFPFDSSFPFLKTDHLHLMDWDDQGQEPLALSIWHHHGIVQLKLI